MGTGSYRIALNQMYVLYFLFLSLHNHHICASNEKRRSAMLEATKHHNSDEFISRSRQARDDHHSPKTSNAVSLLKAESLNWTKKELIDLLDKHGYVIKEGSGGRPLGMIGDVAYYPEELLPEMGLFHERRNLMGKKRLWLDGNKASIVAYYYDVATTADHKVFEAAVKTWSDNTCIKFAKKPPNACQKDLGYAAVCVGDFGGCWSKLGRTYGIVKQSQEMSVMPEGCEKNAAAHEFGHALGLCHEMARADRDKHIHVLYHNIDIDVTKITEKNVRNSWFQGAHCSAEQMYDVPKPYDPMSLMQYGTSDFAAEDQRPVYLHKNPHYQYMFDYHRKAGYIQSHYDNLVMNVGYQCVPGWRKNCEDSGKSVPKCQNYGYIGKSCKCLCPKGFSGSTCGTKEGPMFPLMDRAKAMLDISEPGLVDMKGKGMHDENRNYPKPEFTSWQYIAVIIRSGDETRISVDVAQNFENVKQAFARAQQKWIEVGSYLCQYGLHVYVGNAAGGHMRVECISSMVNNEPKEHRTVLRSRTNVLDIIGVGGWGVCYGGSHPITRKAMEFQFTISFLDRPEDNLGTEKKNPGKVKEKVDKFVKDTKKAIAAAMKGKKPVIFGGMFMLLLVAGGGAAFWWYKKTHGEAESDSDGDSNEGKKDEPSPEGSSSDSSD